jgi:FMN-dependent NADH-azoreductase
MKLLHIDSSITGAGSVSRKVTQEIVDSLRKARTDIEVVYRDVASEPLAHATLGHLPSAHPLSAQGEPVAEEQRRRSDAALDEFLAADVVVIGAPMYNFSIPSQLKAWIDRVIVPGKTFAYTATGPQGLAAGKRVIIAITRGGFYTAGPWVGLEHVETYLRGTFGFIGINDVEFIVAEGLATAQRDQALNQASQTVSALQI